MITMTNFVAAVKGCKVAYGIDSVHVSMLARELGVGVHEVVEFINDNPGAFSTSAVNSGERATYGLYVVNVVAAIYRYGRLLLETEIKKGDSGGTIAVSVEGGAFSSETEIEKVGSWIFDAGSTDAALSSVSFDDETGVATLTLTGTIDAGNITLMVKPVGMLNGYFSEPAVLTIEDVSGESE